MLDAEDAQGDGHADGRNDPILLHDPVLLAAHYDLAREQQQLLARAIDERKLVDGRARVVARGLLHGGAVRRVRVYDAPRGLLRPALRDDDRARLRPLVERDICVGAREVSAAHREDGQILVADGREHSPLARPAVALRARDVLQRRLQQRRGQERERAERGRESFRTRKVSHKLASSKIGLKSRAAARAPNAGAASEGEGAAHARAVRGGPSGAAGRPRANLYAV